MYNGQFKEVLPGFYDRQETIKQVFAGNYCFQVERQYYYQDGKKLLPSYIVYSKRKASKLSYWDFYLYVQGTSKIFYSYSDALKEIKRRVLETFYF